MDMMISRILKYLNGCLIDDYLYRIGTFIVKNYTQMCQYELERFMREGHFSESEVIDFCQRFGYCNFDTFKQKLMTDQQLRMDQIHSRMINVGEDKFINNLNLKSTHDEFIHLIDDLCELIFKEGRIVIVGAFYSSSIAVDFQTDLISLGKEVVEYHHFDKEFQFREDDIVIFITSTGRTMEHNVKKMVAQNLCQSYVVLMTQNIKYINFENVCADYVVHVLGKFDGLEFGYQVMMVLDLLRIHYYQKYYL